MCVRVHACKCARVRVCVHVCVHALVSGVRVRVYYAASVWECMSVRACVRACMCACVIVSLWNSAMFE